MSDVPTGPFETEDDARTDRAVRAVYASSDIQAANYAMLDAACASTGVRTGDYDRRILYWLANYEPQMCAVIAGIIRRAAQPPEGTVTEWAVRFDGEPGQSGRATFPVSTYGDDAEGAARRSAREVNDRADPEVTATVESCRVTPWTEAPEVQ